MADSKITALTAISTVDPTADPLVIVDVSDTSMAASGTTKKSTINQLLGSGGTATLASATITGDLTVATDRLKVVTGSTAVQIGATTQTQIGTTAWPSTDIGKSNARFLVGNEGIVINWNESSPVIGNYSSIFAGAKTGIGATTIGGLQIRAGIENASNRDGFCSFWTSNQAAGGYVKRYEIDSNGVSTWSVSGSTAMTLNSTGLGVGVSPSAWWSNEKALQIGSGAFFSGRTANPDVAEIGANQFINSSLQRIYIGNGYASRYQQDGGVHQWFTAPSGTAGNAITFTQAMTLDASGNLLVGTTSTGGSASNSVKNVGGVFSTVNGATGSTATGVAATLFTAPNEAVFIVSAYIVGSSAPANYNAVAIVSVSGGTAAITTISSALNLTISLSGLNVRATQTSGVNQAFAYSAIRIS